MRLLNKILRQLASRSLPMPNQKERALIDALQARIRATSEILTDQASNNAELLWLENRTRLRRELLDKDPRTFFNFRVIRETMFVDDPAFIAYELKALRSSPAWRSRWRPAIGESESIPAPSCPYFSRSSGNLIHQAYHLWQFEHVTGLDISRLGAILEFGGGYGAMCRLVHRLGFRGRYFIFDFPEFSALQEFYLCANDIPIDSFPLCAAGACCFSEYAQFEELNRTASYDLFLAAWSLSETPFAFRCRVLDAVKTRNVLIGYQHAFEALDNTAFFSAWSREKHGKLWQSVPAGHLPDWHAYLIGTSTV